MQGYAETQRCSRSARPTRPMPGIIKADELVSAGDAAPNTRSRATDIDALSRPEGLASMRRRLKKGGHDDTKIAQAGPPTPHRCAAPHFRYSTPCVEAGVPVCAPAVILPRSSTITRRRSAPRALCRDPPPTSQSSASPARRASVSKPAATTQELAPATRDIRNRCRWSHRQRAAPAQRSLGCKPASPQRRLYCLHQHWHRPSSSVNAAEDLSALALSKLHPSARSKSAAPVLPAAPGAPAPNWPAARRSRASRARYHGNRRQHAELQAACRRKCHALSAGTRLPVDSTVSTVSRMTVGAAKAKEGENCRRSRRRRALAW